MATTIVTKFGSDAPAASDIVRGELAVDTENGRLYTENSSGAVVEIGLNPEGNVDVTGTVTADGLTVEAASGAEAARFVTNDATAANNAGALIYNIASATAATRNSQLILDPSGANASGGDYLIISAKGDNSASIINYHATSTLALGTAGVERMRIDSSGNVGIGTSTVNRKLEVAGNNNAGAKANYIRITDTDTSATADNQAGGIEFFTNDSVAGIAASMEVLYAGSGGGGEFTFNTAASSSAGVVEAMRIDENGNVGIGSATANHFSTAGATNILGVKGTTGGLISIAATGTNFSGIDLGTDTTRRGGIYSLNDSHLAFYTNATNSGGSLTERMRITSAGSIQIPNQDAINELEFTGTEYTNIYSATTSGMDVGTTGSGYLRLLTNNTERMRIDDSGNLMVGKTSAEYTTAGVMLEGDGTISSVKAGTTGVFNRLTSEGDIITFRKDGTTVGSIGTLSGNSYIGTGDTGLLFAASVNSVLPHNTTTNAARDAEVDLGYSSGGTQRRFKNLYLSGIIAKGTGGELDLRSDGGGFNYKQNLDLATAGVTFTGQSNRGDVAAIRLYQTTTGTDGGYIRFDTCNSGSTTPTEKMRIDSSGNLIAGTTAATNSAHTLYKSQANNALVVANGDSTTPYGVQVRYSGADPNDTNSPFYTAWGFNGGSFIKRFEVRSNGGIANYQANDANLSDERVKRDISPVGSMWDKFKALEIVNFKYKDQTHTNDNIGVIAQQVESVAPEFVSNEGFGETPEGEAPLKTIYTTDLYHANIKALQEAMDRIETLEAKVAALES